MVGSQGVADIRTGPARKCVELRNMWGLGPRNVRRVTGVMAYSKHLEADVALRDGSTVHVQPVRPADEDALGEFLASLSIDSRWLRFFGGANMERHGPRRSCRRLPRLLRGTLYSACPT